MKYPIHNYKLGDFGIKHPIYNTTARTYKRQRMRKYRMATIRESAKEYVSPETKNIVELESVSTELDIKEKVVNEGEKGEFRYNFIVVDDEEYRVPNSVLKQLKAQLEAKEDSSSFRVTKSGEGLKTEYTVIMLD